MIPWPIRAHNPNGISIGSGVFAEMTAECPYIYFTMGRPLKIVPFQGGIWTPSNIWFPGPTQSSTQMASRSVQRFFAGLTSVTDGQTDRQTMLLGR